MDTPPPLLFPPDAQFARVQQNERMIGVESLSGYSMLLPEDERVDFFSPDVSDEVLGSSLIAALNKSRFVDPRKELDFFDIDRYRDLVNSREKQIISRSKFRSYRRAYENMRYVDLWRYSGKIFAIPHGKKGGQFWVSLPDDQTVVIPAASSAQQIGVAAKLALSRCIQIP